MISDKEVISMTEQLPDLSLDLRGIICPLNMVQAKQKMKTLSDGQTLEIFLDSGDPLERVPRALKDEGHRVVSVKKNDDDSFVLQVKKNVPKQDGA